MHSERIREAIISHHQALQLEALNETILEKEVQATVPYLSFLDESGRSRVLMALSRGEINLMELKRRCQSYAPDGLARHNALNQSNRD